MTAVSRPPLRGIRFSLLWFIMWILLQENKESSQNSSRLRWLSYHHLLRLLLRLLLDSFSGNDNGCFNPKCLGLLSIETIEPESGLNDHDEVKNHTSAASLDTKTNSTMCNQFISRVDSRGLLPHTISNLNIRPATKLVLVIEHSMLNLRCGERLLKGGGLITIPYWEENNLWDLI